jgi:hypothetical protein
VYTPHILLYHTSLTARCTMQIRTVTITVSACRETILSGDNSIANALIHLDFVILHIVSTKVKTFIFLEMTVACLYQLIINKLSKSILICSASLASPSVKYRRGIKKSVTQTDSLTRPYRENRRISAHDII